MKTSHFALAVLTASLLCVGNVVGQDEKTTKSDVANTLAELVAKAKTGDTEAMVGLGYMYAGGQGVIQDYKEAVKWWRKAAELGNTEAMAMLGGRYLLGMGVIKDFVEAYALLNIAAANGHKAATKLRDSREKTMTPERIAEGQKRSREILKSISP